MGGMITLNPQASTPLHEQLAEQIRYRIGAGTYKTGDALPATRKMGEALGISFHTVRKAYQLLATEGYLHEGRRGYVVAQSSVSSQELKMEQGAVVMQDALRRLVGLGYSEDEMSYLFEEQMAQLSLDLHTRRILFAAPIKELAESGAHQLHLLLREQVQALSFPQIKHARDAEVIITPFQNLRAVREKLPQKDVYGVYFAILPEVLQTVAELLPNESIGLITRDAESIPYLIRELQAETGYAGDITGVSLEGDLDSLALVDHARLLLYTPACKRRLHTFLQKRKHAELRMNITSASEALLLRQIPR